MLTNAIIIYLAIGAMFATICCVGGAKAAISVEVLGRIISTRWVFSMLIFQAATLWPLVLWLVISGRSAKSKTMKQQVSDELKAHGYVWDPKAGHYTKPLVAEGPSVEQKLKALDETAPETKPGASRLFAPKLPATETEH